MKKLLILLCLVFSASALAQSNLDLPRPTQGPGTTALIRNAPSYVDVRVLAATVSETHTVPSLARWVIFSGDCNFYARPGASAAVPAADVTDGTGSEQNPAGWWIPPGVTQITLIAATSCKVTLSFYL